MTKNMIDISKLYTGIKTQGGVKVYLGDKLTGPYYFPMLVQYDFKEGKFMVTTTGKSKSPYRSYIIEDLALMPALYVISNSLFFQSVKVADLVKITVQNIKDSIFKEGDVVRVVEVNEWDILVECLSDNKLSAVIQYHEFLEMWRFED